MNISDTLAVQHFCVFHAFFVVGFHLTGTQLVRKSFSHLFSVFIHEIHSAMRIGSLCIGGDDWSWEKKWDRTKRMKNVNVIPPISEAGNELHFIFHLTNLSFEFENFISSFFVSFSEYFFCFHFSFFVSERGMQFKWGLSIVLG